MVNMLNWVAGTTECVWTSLVKHAHLCVKQNIRKGQFNIQNVFYTQILICNVFENALHHLKVGWDSW